MVAFRGPWAPNVEKAPNSSLNCAQHIHRVGTLVLEPMIGGITGTTSLRAAQLGITRENPVSKPDRSTRWAFVAV